VLPHDALIVHLNGHLQHKLIWWFKRMQPARDRPPLLTNGAEAPTGIQVRLKERPEHWLAPILPPATVLMRALLMEVPTCGNASHEVRCLTRCPDDPLNE
jgi:hypothetical protein